jgi:hypothetical protein
VGFRFILRVNPIRLITPAARKWFGSEFLDLVVNFKRDEEQAVAGLDPQTICDRYAAVF